jgi:enoyl-CoA hydratase/carnithine racemase
MTISSHPEPAGQAERDEQDGAGPAFCADIELKEAGERRAQAPDDRDRPSDWRIVQEEIRRHPAIVIASVNGFALGGGVTLVNAADLAVASETAQFGRPEAGFGVYPRLAGPSTQLRLQQKRAAWMVLTAKRIDGRPPRAGGWSTWPSPQSAWSPRHSRWPGTWPGTTP